MRLVSTRVTGSHIGLAKKSIWVFPQHLMKDVWPTNTSRNSITDQYWFWMIFSLWIKALDNT